MKSVIGALVKVFHDVAGSLWENLSDVVKSGCSPRGAAGCWMCIPELLWVRAHENWDFLPIMGSLVLPGPSSLPSQPSQQPELDLIAVMVLTLFLWASKAGLARARIVIQQTCLSAGVILLILVSPGGPHGPQSSD